jgi:hypothetical protein
LGKMRAAPGRPVVVFLERWRRVCPQPRSEATRAAAG